MDKKEILNELKTKWYFLNNSGNTSTQTKLLIDEILPVVEALCGRDSSEYKQLVVAKTDYEKAIDSPYNMAIKLAAPYVFFDDFKKVFEPIYQSIVKNTGVSGIRDRDKVGEVEKMNESETGIIRNLGMFRNNLIEFTRLRRKLINLNQTLSKEEYQQLDLLFDDISIGMGTYGQLIKEVISLEKIPTNSGQQDVWNYALSHSADPIILVALDSCVAATSKTMGQVTTDIDNGIRDAKSGYKIKTSLANSVEPIKAFIAHEGETRALTTLKEFLEALGIHYYIAEIKASDGRGIEKQVDWSQSKADFAIILATKGKAINKNTGKHYMGLNVADELGRARQVFRNKIILLEQRGLEPHSNIKEIICEKFTPQSMDKAFIKMIRELTNWGFITSGIPKEPA